MSKYRNNRRKKRQSGFDILDAELVPLTDVLIDYLAKKWEAPRHEIIEMRDEFGVMYCPSRESLMTPWKAGLVP